MRSWARQPAKPSCAIDAYNRRDLGALVAEMHPEIELQPPLTALAGNAYRGHDGVAQWPTDLDETFEHTHIEPVEVEDVGGLVLALTTFSVEGRLPLESELGLLCDMRDGLIVSWAGHFDHSAARAEARERAGTPGVRLVRAAIDAYNRRDAEALAAIMSPDVDLRPPVTELWGIAYSGHDGIRRWMADVEDSFVYAQIVPNELEDLGGLVMALTTVEVKGGESQLEFDSELGPRVRNLRRQDRELAGPLQPRRGAGGGRGAGLDAARPARPAAAISTPPTISSVNPGPAAASAPSKLRPIAPVSPVTGRSTSSAHSSTSAPITTSASAAGRERPNPAPNPISTASSASRMKAPPLRSNPLSSQRSASSGLVS
jgi:ketosteroid isomerase-like protein